MIRVKRSKVRKPEVLDSENARNARAAAEKFYGQDPTKRAQKNHRFDKDVFGHRVVQMMLVELFDGKCAFCETRIEQAKRLDVIHYRPASGALGLDGTFDENHYWGLAYEWPNLYLSCRECERHKGHRFPVDGPRAPSNPTPAQLKKERPLLLDPCNDKPEQHLLFNKDGFVAGRTNRGEQTIEILGLNRSSLVSMRKAARTQTQKLLGTAFRTRGANLQAKFATSLAGVLGPDKPFLGLRRQIVRDWYNKLAASRRRYFRKALISAGVEVPEETTSRRKKDPDIEQKQVFQQHDAFQAKQAAYKLDDSAKEGYFSGARLVEKVSIRNFRGLEKLDLEIDAPETGNAPWLVFLGENGTGKSSILQALALTLMGTEYRAGIDVKVSGTLHHSRRSGKLQNAPSGSVEVWATGFKDPIRLDFSEKTQVFQSNEEQQKLLLLGYGSTRLLPRNGEPQPEPVVGSGRYARVKNLFNPFVPLGDAAEWLLSEESRHFDKAATVIKSLLSLDDDDKITHDGKKVYVQGPHSQDSLAELSDGFQSVLALSADIMRVMFAEWSDMRLAEGVVLIDELESHLHPSWKMQIVRCMREAFPRIQFIVTTHDPLCLRGLNKGEVVVLKRDEQDGIFAITDLPDVAGLQVDQLLTSEHFGLNTTIDPEVDKTFDKYYRLLAKASRTPDEEQLLLKYRADLRLKDMLGGDRREQMMLQAIDKFLAVAEKTPDPEARKKLRKETQESLIDTIETS